jgi:hypothetical protein
LPSGRPRYERAAWSLSGSRFTAVFPFNGLHDVILAAARIGVPTQIADDGARVVGPSMPDAAA